MHSQHIAVVVAQALHRCGYQVERRALDAGLAPEMCMKGFANGSMLKYACPIWRTSCLSSTNVRILFVW